MRAVLTAGTPSFGSCAGLQVAVAAAGGKVGPAARHEVGFARRISSTAAGREHPLLAGRPAAWDALAIHSDAVTRLPPGATLLAGNTVCPVQAVEIRHDRSLFWGLQYHPELDLSEMAAAIRRQGDDVLDQGLARSGTDVERQAVLLDALHAEPERLDLAWRLGIDEEITDPRPPAAGAGELHRHAADGMAAPRWRQLVGADLMLPHRRSAAGTSGRTMRLPVKATRSA